jgi:transposase InsO family protein
MSKAQLVIAALFVEHQSAAEVAARYGVHRAWVYKLKARYEAEGEAALQPRSRRPKSSPTATPAATVELVLRLRKQLSEAGLDAGADTIGWHLTRHHRTTLSRATINRILVRAGAVAPAPEKRPKSSYIRFEAAQPNECWQSDFTHYRLANPDGTPGADVEILTWIDDCSRYLLSVTAHPRVTGPIVLATFRDTVASYGIPASTLTDNGMVFTTRLSGGKGGRNGLETELRSLNVRQKNSRPNHPTTCGKVERVQQTFKKWLRAQPIQPATVDQLQQLLEAFVVTYNQHRPHRSLPHRATPATIYDSMPKATPTANRDADTHDRVRRDKIDDGGSVTLRLHGRLHHIGVGRTHARTPVILLIQDLHVRIVDATTGELLRELTIDPRRDYQPTGRQPQPRRRK